MKKILYLINDLDIGGAENVLLHLVENLNKAKYQIQVVSILPIGLIGERIETLNVKVYSLDSRKFNFKAIRRLYSIVIDYQPDILHCFLPQSIILGRLLGHLLHVPLIISSYRSSNFGSHLQTLIFRLTDKWSHVNTVVSSEMATSIEKNHITRQKPIIIRNGIDIKSFVIQNSELRMECRQQLKIDQNDIIITAVGQLREAKGYLDLVDTIAILKNKYSNIHFLILGEGKLRLQIENSIRKYHLEGYISLLGQKNNPVFYLNASDMYILPSLWEGFPNALLEAMACGLPSVATKVSGAVEIIQDGFNGFLAEVNNPSDIADKLENLILMKESERKEIGLLARQTVERYYSIEKMVSEYEKLYN